MGIRDLFKKDNQVKSNVIEGNWNFKTLDKSVTIRDFTDTGVEYADVYDGATPMKLYTFTMWKNNLESLGMAGKLGKMYETVAFEAPASWDIREAINNGLLGELLNKTNAIHMSYNDRSQIDLLGRFDLNSNFTYSSPNIQEYIDTTYTPFLNEQAEQQRIVAEKNRIKENEPGFFEKAIGKVLDFFDGIKERRNERREMKLLAAAPEQRVAPKVSRSELGLSSNEIRQAGMQGFYIGDSNQRNVMAIDILGEPQMLQDGNYLYTVKKQTIGTFNSPSNLSQIPNCQFSLPVSPENFTNFLNGCEDPENPFAKTTAEALMLLLNQNSLPGKGLYIGGLVVGRDGNLQYSQCENIHAAIDYVNGINNQRRAERAQQHEMSDDYMK